MLTVAVLGRVEVRRDGGPAPVPSGLTTELLVRLALDAGRPVRAERLVEGLWQGAAGIPANTLQAKVSQLRHALGDPSALTGGPEGYTLAVDPDRVDALHALRLAHEGVALLAAGEAAAAGGGARIVSDERGVDPGPELAALERQLLTHDPGLEPAARSPTGGRRHGN